MKRIFLVLILILVCGCSNNSIKKSVEKEIKEPTEQAIDNISNASDAALKRSAELIISEVQVAYASALMNSLGDDPTLQDVKNNFSMDNAIWESDKIIYNNEFECSVSVENNLLKVKCLDKELNGQYKVR